MTLDLKTLFERHAYYFYNFIMPKHGKKLPSDNKQKAITMLTAAIHEICETQVKLDFKYWKENQPVYTDEEILDELADAQHFINNSILVLGYTPEQFYEAYNKKLEINIERQMNNY